MSYQPPAYQPPGQIAAPTTHERGAVMVTPLERLGNVSANVDCPYCKRVTKTDPVKVSSGDDG